MENNNKICRDCGEYKAYYTKEYCHFNRQDHGFCAKHEKIVEKQGMCAFWRSNLFRRKMRKKVAIRALNDILTNLSEIRQILGEDEKED